MLDKNLAAPRPPMGWNSWDCYGASATEDILIKNAEFMAAHMKSHGWEYIVCDIQWSEPNASSTEYHPFADLCMDGYSRLIPAPNRFPSGFKAIADKIHALGLKFGIHIMRGVPRQAVHANTPIKGTDVGARSIAQRFANCIWNTDMYGVDPDSEGGQAYYDSIFELYAEWGVDFVKVDDLSRADYSSDSYANKREIEMIRRALDRCGRQMVLSLSPGPSKPEAAWHLSQNANMWRITDDLWDEWRLVKAMFERCEVWQTHVKPGCWPDCDMLPLGKLRMFKNGGDDSRLTFDEQRTLMTLWCVFRSPLMMGGDLCATDTKTISLITNDDVLALDMRGTGARQIKRDADEAVWVCRDENGSDYIALFNLSDAPRSVCAAWAEAGLEAPRELRDVWEGTQYAAKTASVCETLAPHASRLLKLL